MVVPDWGRAAGLVRDELAEDGRYLGGAKGLWLARPRSARRRRRPGWRRRTSAEAAVFVGLQGAALEFTVEAHVVHPQPGAARQHRGAGRRLSQCREGHFTVPRRAFHSAAKGISQCRNAHFTVPEDAVHGVGRCIFITAGVRPARWRGGQGVARGGWVTSRRLGRCRVGRRCAGCRGRWRSRLRRAGGVGRGGGCRCRSRPGVCRSCMRWPT